MSQHDVIVVGAGIVGMATALSLQREGHKVTVLDSGAPGSGASMGNAGCICPASCVPESGPGVMMQAPGWLADPLGPLALRWRYLPKFLPWLIRFIRAGQPDRVEAQSQALRALYRSAYDAYTPLLQFAGATGLFQKIGYVIAYETEAAWSKDRGSFAMRARRGVQMTELDEAGMRALEPALNPAFKRGVLRGRLHDRRRRDPAGESGGLRGGPRRRHRRHRSWRAARGALGGGGRRAQSFPGGAARQQGAVGDGAGLSRPAGRSGRFAQPAGDVRRA
jgi:glycine/D-amino acid oxidase-like deaminating enzyme